MSKSIRIMAIFLFISSIFGYSFFASVAAILNVDNRLIVIPYRALVAAISIFLISAFFFKKNFIANLSISSNKTLFLLCVFSFLLLYFTIAFIDSIFYLDYLDYETKSLFWQFYILVTILPAIAFASTINFINERILVEWSMFIGLISLIVILYSYLSLSDFDLNALISGRISLLALNPITIGHTGLSLIILSYVYFVRFDSKFVFKRLIALLSLIVGFTVLIAAGSRGPFLSLLAFILFLIMQRSISFKSFVFFLLIAYLLSILINSFDIYIFDRVSENFLKDDSRDSIYSDTFQLIYENFFFGAGIFSMETSPHNILVESLLVTGFVGFIVFVTILGFSFSYCHSMYSNKENMLIPLLFIQYFVYYMVSGEIQEALMFWLLVFCFLAYNNKLNSTRVSRSSI